MSSPDLFSPEYWQIKALAQTNAEQIQQRIDNKTKPLGSLGQLEVLAKHLASIQLNDVKDQQNIHISRPAILVFAADHGIAKHGISIAPSEVTAQMVHNFLNGGGAINCFCNTGDIQLTVVDAGILQPLDIQHPNFVEQRVGAGTADFSTQPAMTEAQGNNALYLGEVAAKTQLAAGSNILGFGEMGIGNTSSASALISLLLNHDAALTVGTGTGISDAQLIKKQQLIQTAIDRVKSIHPTWPISLQQVLLQVGGFEIAQMCGAMLATAAAGKAILVDGFIASAAALIASRIVPESKQYMIFAHQSAERGHQLILKSLEAKPLLSLGLRLGEGTGAALAMPLLRAAASFYNQMATFDSAQVTI